MHELGNTFGPFPWWASKEIQEEVKEKIYPPKKQDVGPHKQDTLPKAVVGAGRGLPPLLAKLEAEFTKIPGAKKKRSKDELVVYALPQKSHTVEALLSYDKDTKSCFLKLSFQGYNHNERWEKIAEATLLLHSSTILPLSEKPKHLGDPFEWNKNQSVTFTWRVKTLKKIKEAIALLQFFQELSGWKSTERAYDFYKLMVKLGIQDKVQDYFDTKQEPLAPFLRWPFD